MSGPYTWLKDGGVTSAKGYLAAGVQAGIKPKNKRDMALVVSERDAVIGAVFTTNQIKAGPVKVSMEYARNGKVRGVILNSGNANACNGVRGVSDAKSMADSTAKAQNFRPKQVLVCSTGRIGVPLPMPKVERGIKKLVAKLSPENGSRAAEAIMTSDTFAKQCAVQCVIDGRKITIGGMAKGAGMIHPNMATMLCIITTDVDIDKKTLQRCVQESVDQSFNRISIDGDTSTNDTVMVFANGAAGNNLMKSFHPQLEIFRGALALVTKKLSRMIVEDGEGISRVIDLIIKGASNDREARIIAEAIVRSPLVRTSWCGGDPNWGRLMDVIGYCGVKVREELVDIWLDGIIAVRGGMASSTPSSKLRKAVRQRHFTINIDLHLGKGQYNLLTTDLTEDYVTFNKGE